MRGAAVGPIRGTVVIPGQLQLDLEPEDTLADLDLDHAAAVLEAEQAEAARPKTCRCVSGSLVFRPLPTDKATCALCGRPLR